MRSLAHKRRTLTAVMRVLQSMSFVLNTFSISSSIQGKILLLNSLGGSHAVRGLKCKPSASSKPAIALIAFRGSLVEYLAS